MARAASDQYPDAAAAASVSTDAPSPDADPDAPNWRRRVILFLSGQTISLFGSMLVQYAVFWYLTITYHSGIVMMLAALFGFLPQAVISVFAGVWADRHSRKLLMMGSDAAIAASTLVLAIVMMTGYDAVWLIFLTMAIRSVGAGIQLPAMAAFVPQITPKRSLLRVNGINGSIQSGMALLAPAAAGGLYAWASGATGGSAASLVPLFFIDVVTAAIGIGLLALIPVGAVRRAADAPKGYFADLADGVRYVAHHAFVRWLLVVLAIIFVLTVAPTNLAPLMLVRSFDAGEQQNVVRLAVLEIVISVGMVLGGIVVAALFAKRSRIAMIVVSSLVFGLVSIGLGLSPTVWVFFGFLFLFGLTIPFVQTPGMTLLQETVAPDRQGRVFGFVGIVNAVAMPLGMVIFGPLADVVPIEALMVSAGILTFLLISLAVWLPAGRRAVAAAREASAARDPEAAAVAVEPVMQLQDAS